MQTWFHTGRTSLPSPLENIKGLYGWKRTSRTSKSAINNVKKVSMLFRLPLQASLTYHVHARSRHATPRLALPYLHDP